MQNEMVSKIEATTDVQDKCNKYYRERTLCLLSSYLIKKKKGKKEKEKEKYGQRSRRVIYAMI